METLGDLLRERADINRRLRQFPIFRTKSNHLVPLSEETVARMVGGRRGSEGQPGWDVIAPDGVTIQVKAGAISSPEEYRTFGGARPGRVADWYAFMALDDSLTRVWWLFMIPADEVPGITTGKQHATDSRRVRSHPRRIDRTADAQFALDGLLALEVDRQSDSPAPPTAGSAGT